MSPLSTSSSFHSFCTRCSLDHRHKTHQPHHYQCHPHFVQTQISCDINQTFSLYSPLTCGHAYVHAYVFVWTTCTLGIWTPGTQTPNTSFTNLNDIHPKVSTPTPPLPPLPAQGVGQPVWTPQPSPTSGRKEFRPVRFESPTLSRRYILPQSNSVSTQIPPPWRQSTTTTDGDSSYAAPSPRSAYSYTNLSTPTTTIGSAGSTNYCDSIPSESSLLNHVGTGPSQSVADKIKSMGG